MSKMFKMFKAGDKVRCLKSYSDQFTEGKIYTVSMFVAPTVIVELDDIGSTTNGFHMDFFEKVEIMKVKDIKVGMKFKSLKYRDGVCSKELHLEKGIAEVTAIGLDETPFRLEFRGEYGDYIDCWWNTRAGMKKALKKGWLVPTEEEEVEPETEEPKEELKEELKVGDIIRITEDCRVDCAKYYKGELRSVKGDGENRFILLPESHKNYNAWYITKHSLKELKYELVKFE